MSMRQIPDMMDIRQLCELLGCKRTKAYQLVASGAFRSLRVGKKILIPKVDVADFIESRLQSKIS